MLKGKELGDALVEAMRLKGATTAQVAKHFRVKSPSVSEWKRFGRIGKQHIDELVRYFSDVVGPEHWGITSSGLAGTDRSELSREAVELINAIEAADLARMVASSFWKHLSDLLAEMEEQAKPVQDKLPTLSDRQQILADLYAEQMMAGDKTTAAMLRRMLETDAAKKANGDNGQKEKRSARR